MGDRKHSTATMKTSMSSLNSRRSSTSASADNVSLTDSLKKLSSAGSHVYRKLSAAVAPSTQLLGGFEALVDKMNLTIQIDNHSDLVRAMRQAPMNSHWNFDPVRFWVRCLDDKTILYRIEVTPDEINVRDLSPDSTKIMSVSLPRYKGDLFHTQIGKVKNASGFKMFTMWQRAESHTVDVHKYTGSDANALPYLNIEQSHNWLLEAFRCCGLCYDAHTYRIRKAGSQFVLAEVQVVAGGFGEATRTIKIAYNKTNVIDDADVCQTKAVVIAYALLILVRNAYPQLATSMEEHRVTSRRALDERDED